MFLLWGLNPFSYFIVSGQQLTCLGSSLERHLGNLEEKRELGGREKDVAKTKF